MEQKNYNIKSYSNNKGFAILITLIIVSTISIIALGLFKQMKNIVNDFISLIDLEQSMQYAMGIERLIESNIKILNKEFIPDLTNGGLYVYYELANASKIDGIGGAYIESMVTDISSNCLNINSLISGVNKEFSIQKPTQNMNIFFDLFEILKISKNKSENIIFQIIDWLDQDFNPLMGGAEDNIYLNYKKPFYGGNRQFVDISELKLLPDMDLELYNKIKPYICVMPVSNMNNININRIYKPIILSAISNKVISVARAKSLIENRPIRGWKSAESFLQEFAKLDRDNFKNKNLLVTQTNYYEAKVEIYLNKTRLSTKIIMDKDGKLAYRTFDYQEPFKLKINNASDQQN